jgi:hypothetical protein
MLNPIEPDASETTSWSPGNGCHVCGGAHGSREYFNICAPRSRARKAYLEELKNMSVLAMKPNFKNKEEYLAWRTMWKLVYAELSLRIRKRKLETKQLQREASAYMGVSDAKSLPAAKAQKELSLMRRDATKMMTLMDEAKKRRDRILSMRAEIAGQPFPLEMDADRLDLYYNRAHNEFDVIPRWVIKTKGKSFYVDHIDATVPWSTRELESGPTRGMIRFRKCKLMISADRVATLRDAA